MERFTWLLADSVTLLAAGGFLVGGIVLLRPFLKESGLSHLRWAFAMLLFRCLPGSVLLVIATIFAFKAVDDLTEAQRPVSGVGARGTYATFGTVP